MIDQINAMLNSMTNAPEIVRPSRGWITECKKNLNQIIDSGYLNFKQTVAISYFTFTYCESSQIDFLQKNLSTECQQLALQLSQLTPTHPVLTKDQSFHYNLLTYLIWQYASQTSAKKFLDIIEEPLEGNPPRIFYNKKLISQDLVNSVLEFESITSQINNRISNPFSVLELGSGYGRTGYVFLRLIPGIKYIFSDLPPALAITEKYICNQFPSKKPFRFRNFKNYAEIKDEFEASDIVFLLPHQVSLLPEKSVNLFVNISSFHEMTLEQIGFYFNEIERLTKDFLYIKQWKVSVHPVDQLVIREEDYPIRINWKKLFWRECPVHSAFFEALLSLS